MAHNDKWEIISHRRPSLAKMVKRYGAGDWEIAVNTATGRGAIVKKAKSGRVVSIYGLPAHPSLVGEEWLRCFLLKHLRPFDFRKEWREWRYEMEKRKERELEDLKKGAMEDIKVKNRKVIT